MSRSEHYTHVHHHLFPQGQLSQSLIIGILLISAFCIRAYRINDPPLDLNPTRQYRSVIIARAYYFQSLNTIPDWRKRIALINRKHEGSLEPPILEHLAYFAYRVVGVEHIWLPRLFSSIFWLIGGVFLFLTCKKLVSYDAAVLSTAFYLFVPYSVLMSRTFQPDSMMVMMFIINIFTISKYYDKPTKHKLIIASFLAALAFFIKPLCFFTIFGVFISLSIYKKGIRRSLTTIDNLIFVVLSILPMFSFYMYGFFKAGFIRYQAMGSFLPNIILSSFYWEGWFKSINSVVGLTAFIGALIGLVILRNGFLRAFLIGLWIGYFILGLVFNYHIHTHKYYSLQLIPIVALSLGTLSAYVIDRLGKFLTKGIGRFAVLGILAAILFINIIEIQKIMYNPDFDQKVKIAKEIGEIVNHSKNTIFLVNHYYGYGEPLKYYGEFSGAWWPQKGDFRKDKLKGKQKLNIKERFNTYYVRNSPEFFIVTNFQAFEEQQDLRQYLLMNFPVIVKNYNYIIFDLTNSVND